MENIFAVDSKKLDKLKPLAEWRILDLATLLELGEQPNNYWSLKKDVRYLERIGVIKGIRHPLNKKKYVYFANIGGKLVGDNLYREATEYVLIHQMKVTEVALDLLKGYCFNKATLEHRIVFTNAYPRPKVPNALLEGERNGAHFKMALEVHIFFDHFERMREIVRTCLETDAYGHALLLFPSIGVLNNYKEFLDRNFEKKYQERIMLFANTTLLSGKQDLSQGVGFFQGRDFNFNDLFTKLEPPSNATDTYESPWVSRTIQSFQTIFQRPANPPISEPFAQGRK